MTTFPDDFDSDIEIPRIDKNVSEISGDVINSIRDAVFAIQRTVGLAPQGNKPSLSDRMGVSIDANGNIKAKALESLGLLALPVLNKHIGITAGIEETKLELDYRTSYLKGLIDSMRLDLTGIAAGLSSAAAANNQHFLGTGYWHDGYHIKVNIDGSGTGIAGLEATTIGDAVNELTEILVSGRPNRLSHIDWSLPDTAKHRASDIAVDTTSFTVIDRSATDVQAAFDSLNSAAGAFGVEHADGFHANGILREVNSGSYYNANRKLLGPVTGISYTEGTGVIKVPGVTSFADLRITAGDIFEIAEQSGIVDSGTYQIRAIGPLTDAGSLGDLPTLDVDELAIFYVFKESRSAGDGIGGTVYKPSSDSTEFAPLACIAKNNETTVDSITIMNPDAARVVSVGFNGAVLNSDGYEIGLKVGIGNQRHREIIIPGLNLDRLGTKQADPVTAQSVAERINAYVNDPDINEHFPITAYRLGDEIAIAHNLVGEDYTIELGDGYTGNYALGLDAYGADVIGREIIGSASNTYSINGANSTTLSTIFDGYGRISSDSSTLFLYKNSGEMINPLRYGITAGSVMHVLDHPTLNTNGSYSLYTSNSTSVTLFNPEKINAPTNPTTFRVLFTSSAVSLGILDNTETSLGLVQILVDVNGHSYVHQKLSYEGNLGSAIEIINVTSSFPTGDSTMLVTLNGDFVNFNIIADTLSGDTARIHEDFKGTFKLYHPNGIDYLVIKIIPGSIPGGVEVISVAPSVPEEEAMLLCTAHFNGTLSVTNMVDNRLFGNLGPQQVRDDFIELYSQRPVSDLRSNGVARGFDLMDIPYYDFVTDMEALPLRGGVAYVNGVRCAVETQKVVIQSYDADGLTINGRRIVGINDFGSLQVLSDELGEILTDGYNSSAEFGKILPLYRVDVAGGHITSVIDIRRFINNLDEKIDMIVDESNNLVGNFRTLEGALLYAENYPGHENMTIKIVSAVYPKTALTIPEGISLVGAVPYGGHNKHQIINIYEHDQAFITLSGNNLVENLEISSATASLQGALVSVDGPSVDVHKCLLKFGEEISTNSGDIGIVVNASEDVRIVDNKIDNVFTGISSELGCSELTISNNSITGVSGVGEACGIKIGSTLRQIDNVDLSNNHIVIDNTPNTDLRGIYVDIGETISKLHIVHNKVEGLLNESSENNLSNGIRIENSSGTANKITTLVATDNYINNVKLHDASVYGLYINDVATAFISQNTITSVAIYDSQYDPTALIWLGNSVDVADIHNNFLSDSEARYGICIDREAEVDDIKCSITGNFLKNIGNTSAQYISCLGASNTSGIKSIVSNNKLVGPGEYGIRWRGERSKIIGNHLSRDLSVPTDYSFVYGIYVQAQYVDIENNIITDMNYEGSVGIMNVATGQDGLKILGNTIEGTKMSRLIKVHAGSHMIHNNRLSNITEATAGTNFIYLDGTSGSTNISIQSNIFEGTGTCGVYAPSTNPATYVSILNNVMSNAAFTLGGGKPIEMANTGVTNCFVAGNAFASDAIRGNLGVTPSLPNPTGAATANRNLIGINYGLVDYLAYSAESGITGYETDGAGTFSPHWTIQDPATSREGNYWVVNDSALGTSRVLYIPIAGIPTGATIEGFRVQVKGTVDTTTFTAKLYRRSLTGVYSGTSFPKSDALASTDMGGATTDSSWPTTSTFAELATPDVVNPEISAYYIKFEYLGAPTQPENVRIYGALVKFRY